MCGCLACEERSSQGPISGYGVFRSSTSIPSHCLAMPFTPLLPVISICSVFLSQPPNLTGGLGFQHLLLLKNGRTAFWAELLGAYLRSMALNMEPPCSEATYFYSEAEFKTMCDAKVWPDPFLALSAGFCFCFPLFTLLDSTLSSLSLPSLLPYDAAASNIQTASPVLTSAEFPTSNGLPSSPEQ